MLKKTTFLILINICSIGIKAQPIQCSGTAQWEAYTEMEGGLNTNFNGTTFSNGNGHIAHYQPEAWYNNGYNVFTNALTQTFVNSKYDAVTFGCSDTAIGQAVNYGYTALGGAKSRFIDPTTGYVVSKVQQNVNKLQYIINQYFTFGGQEMLVTWVLPPYWNNTTTYVPFVFLPGFGHTNNSKMFADDYQFIKTYINALTSSTQKNIVMVHINCGGQTSYALHPDFENVLENALLWGSINLKLDLNKVVLNGASRGGHASFVLGSKLSSKPNIKVKGIFASVFGVYGDENNVGFELIPAYPGLYGGSAEFPYFKDIVFQKNYGNIDMIRRSIGAINTTQANQYGPLGASISLFNSNDSTYVFMAQGLGDPSVLASSGVRIHDKLVNGGIKTRTDLFLNKGHEAGDSIRNILAKQFVVALANNTYNYSSMTYNTSLNFIDGNSSYSLNDNCIIPLMRHPISIINNRKFNVDLIGPVNQPFQIKFYNKFNVYIGGSNGLLDDFYKIEEYTWTGITDSIKVEYAVNNIIVGSAFIKVENNLPLNLSDYQAKFRNSVMPAVYNTNYSVFCLSTILDLNEFEQYNFLPLYPNPSSTFIYVECKNGFQIYNSTGILVKQNNQPTTQINIADLPAGLYILKTDNKVGRFIKD